MNVIAYGADHRHARGEFCPRHSFPFYVLCCFRTDYLFERSGELCCGTAGDYLLHAPGQVVYHGPLDEATEGFRNDWLYLEASAMSAFLARYPLPVGEPFRVGGEGPLAALIEAIDRERQASLDGFADKCDLLLGGALIDLFRAYRRRTAPSADKLEGVRAEILRAYAHPWTLAEMAALGGYSPSHFSALYRARFGRAPVSDLIRHRIEQAKRILLYDAISVGELAHAVGFSSLYYFSKYFKKHEGLSPVEYRKQYVP